MKILFATSNPHKQDELLAIWSTQCAHLGQRSVELVTLAGVDPDHQILEPVEDQPTFESNATLKACHYAQATGLWVLADDSGLEVDALGGRPGVRSARYAGVTGPRPLVDQANNQKLLHELGPRPAQERTARFVCAMALCASPGASRRDNHGHASGGDGSTGPRVLALVRGTVEGQIIGPADLPRGRHGFGYDPLFLIPKLGKTTAQLAASQKNTISHRGVAARMMWQKIQELGDDPAT